MFGFRLACLLTKYLEYIAGAPVALLFDQASGSILGWSRDRRTLAVDLGTASVNLQRGLGARVKNCLILTSAPPEVVCLGMAALTQVTNIIHFDGSVAKQYNPGNDLRPGPAYRALKEPVYPPKIAEWMDLCSRLLQDKKLHDFATEFANVPAGSDVPSKIQNVISDGEVEPENHFPPAPQDADGALIAERNPAVDSFWMSVARRLVGAVHTGANLVNPAMRRGHNIGCILVNLNNRILAWGVNTLNNNPTYHAETKCMWMFQHRFPGEKVPKDATLYTTLQSCLMCSATIKHACADHDVRVVFADRDKTPPSVLTRGGGAREQSLSTILRNEYSRLLAQHLLLARARWDRVRRAYQTDLLAQALRQPLRETVQADIIWLKNRVAPSILEVQEFATLALAEHKGLIRNVRLEIQQGAETEDISEAKSKIRGAMNGAPESLIVAVLQKFETNSKSFRFKAKFLANLNTIRDRGIEIEREATKLPFSGGAPVLLQNPVTFEKLYQMPVIDRPGETDLQTKIVDLTTQIHGITLLIQVLNIATSYGDH